MHWRFDLGHGCHATVRNGIIEDEGERYWAGLWDDDDQLLREMTTVLPFDSLGLGYGTVMDFARDLAGLNYIKWMNGEPSDANLHGYIHSA